MDDIQNSICVAKNKRCNTSKSQMSHDFNIYMKDLNRSKWPRNPRRVLTSTARTQCWWVRILLVVRMYLSFLSVFAFSSVGREFAIGQSPVIGVALDVYA
jgi:hypothetical protein